MSVAADIILIITAIQSNGNLSYTLNVFKTKHFLKFLIAEGLAQWLRSLPPNPEVPGSIPGLVEG